MKQAIECRIVCLIPSVELTAANERQHRVHDLNLSHRRSLFLPENSTVVRKTDGGISTTDYRNLSPSLLLFSLFVTVSRFNSHCVSSPEMINFFGLSLARQPKVR